MRTAMNVLSIAGFFLVAIGTPVLAQESRGGYAPPMTIPTGAWEGTGTYLDYKEVQAIGKKEPAQPGSTLDSELQSGESGQYKTTLKIDHRRVDGVEVTVMEIESLRGKTQHLDDEATRVRLAVRERSRPGANAAVIETVAWEYNPDLTKPIELPADDIWITGTLMATGDAVVLHLYYFVPQEGDTTAFADTFVFRGNELLKVGSIVNHERDRVDAEKDPHAAYDALDTRGMITWTEKLVRTQ